MRVLINAASANRLGAVTYLTTDVPVNREVLSDAATFFEISNPASCAREIERLLVEPQRSEQLRGRALERSYEFSWSRYTRELLDVFRNLDSRDSI